ncbi:MAG: chromate transporter, partial [Burkholderiales bacterium]
CMLLPGPEAQQLAVYIGWLMHRTWGGIVAGTLFVLPSIFILLLLSWIYLAFGHITAVAGVLYGIKPAVTAVVLFAAYRIGSRALKNSVLIAIAIAAFVALYGFNLPFPVIIFLAGLFGAVYSRYSPQTFHIASAHAASGIAHEPALIDDDTPTPMHALFSWKKFVHVAMVGTLIWIILMLLLIALFGKQSVLTHMAWFFTKAALLTFGGAYAVLPYVVQGGVIEHQWLTAAQMIDGLALGETTPGPLIMVVTFVGFVGGWTKPVFGPDALFASAFIAASIVTLFTFLPSFIFIFLGGPFIETTHGNLKFTAPLSAITAAVVGVIVNLALFFAWHVFWPKGSAASPDWFSIALCAAACIALFRFKANVIMVIGLCAMAGLAFTFLRA